MKSCILEFQQPIVAPLHFQLNGQLLLLEEMSVLEILSSKSAPNSVQILGLVYSSVPGKHPCIAFQGATVAASIQTYGI